MTAGDHNGPQSAADGADAMMTLDLGGRLCRLPHGSTLAQLLALAGHAPEQVATAVNGQFVPRPQRASHIVFATDTVVLFRPIVGG
ncbi:sulfur carrier protein ThiS [Comamonadaceae bacterium G21597-S1]|nr:sulfur carrier protein ThiS [Comamonadaceae bacterium G21597-S1]